MNLEKFRQEIDEIDSKIIKLLNQRIEIVEKVGHFKDKNGDQFYVKSAREADMIKSLIKKSDPRIHPETIIGIWRHIISNANFLEDEINIGFTANVNKSTLRNYYANFIPLEKFTTIDALFSAWNNEEIQILALNLEKSHSKEPWWLHKIFDRKIKIFASLPFFQSSKEQTIFLAAAKESEQSESDKTLIISHKNHLANLKTTILDSYQNEFFLLAADGFLTKLPEKLTGKIIGHFPTIIESNK